MTLLVTPSARRDELGLVRAARQLGVPHVLVLGHLALLEAWVADHRPRGQGLTAEDVEDAARWEGERGWLAKALLGASYLVELDGALALAGWAERQAVLTERLTAEERADAEYVRGRRDRDRARKHSARVRGRSADASADMSADPASSSPPAASPLPLSPGPPITLSSPPPSTPPPPPAREAAPAVVAVIEAWNRGREGSGVLAAGPCGKQSSKRDAALKRELARFPDPLDWEWCARALAGSPGHNGTSDGGFTADLPWLLARGAGAKLEQWIERGRVLRAPRSAPTGPDATLAAWVEGFGRGLAGAPGALMPEPPSARTADRDRQLGARLRTWAADPATAGWCAPEAATGAARAMLARAKKAQREPVQLHQVLSKPGWLEQFLADGETRTKAAPTASATPAPAAQPRPQRTEETPERKLARLREIEASGMGGDDIRARIAALELELGQQRGETVVVPDAPEVVGNVLARLSGTLTAPGRRSAYRARARASPTAHPWPTPTIEA